MISVLYVDDEPALLDIGKLFLERNGSFIVDTVISAKEGLFALGSKKYDAIISDYQMPEMDGIQFLKRVRASGNTVPFIIFTGRGREEIVIQALNEGADFYLQKGGEPVSQYAELAHKTRLAVQQRRAEASIRDHEQREADIINFLPDATFAIDRAGRVIAWNRAIEKMTGIMAKEMLGKEDHEYAIPFYGERRPILIDLIFELNESIPKKYAYVTHEKDVLLAETTLQLPGGKQVSLMVKASPLYNRQGEIIGAIESIRDITDIKKSEESFRESEEQFAAFMDHLPVTAFIKDEHFTNIFVNRQMEEIFGAKEWIGKSVFDEFPPEVAKKMIEDDRETLREGYRKTVETLVGKSGEPRIFETNKFRIDRGNKPPLIGGFSVDITEQKESEKALNESERRFRDLADLLPQTVYEADMSGRLTYVNHFAFRRFGYTGEDFDKGLYVIQMIAPKDQERAAAAFRAIVLGADSPPHGEEYLARQKDGETFPVTIYSSPVVRNGRTAGIRGNVIDITERKRAEEELRASYEQISAREEELRTQYGSLAESERRLLESEAKFKTLFLKSSEAQVLINASGKIADCNNAYLALVAVCTKEEVIGHSPVEFAPDIQPDQVSSQDKGVANFHDIMEKGSGRYEWVHQKNDTAQTQILSEIIGTLIRIDGQPMIHASIRDISERKRMEDNLVAANREFTSLLDQIQDMYYRTDAKGILISASRSFATLLGYEDISACIGRRVDSFYVNSEDRELFLEELRKNGKSVDYEVHLRRKDGSPVIVSTRSHFYHDPDGNVLGIEGTFRDVTEQKRMEGELRASETQLLATLESTADGILAVDNKGKVLHFNRRFAEIWQIPLTLVESGDDRALLVFVVDQLCDPDAFLQKVEALYQSDAVDMDTLAFRDGRVVERHSFPMTLNRELIGRVWSFRDVTRQKAVETALKESEARLSTILNAAQVGIVIVDTDSHRILQANPKALSLIGASEGDVNDMVCHKFICPAELGKCPVTDLGQIVDSSERILITKAGERIPILKTVISTRLGNRNVLVESFVDITERKRTEEALVRANNKLNLLSTVTRHDIRNQLTALMGYLEIVRSFDDPEKIAGYVKKAVDIGEVIDEQIQFTQDYEIMGLKDPVWQPVDTLVKKAVASVPHPGVKVTIDVPKLEVLADQLLEKVFYNLIDNSVRHGGNRLKTIGVSFIQEGHGLSIIIEDDGLGITGSEKNLVFDRGHGKNTGLGLFLVREILAITGMTIIENGIPGTGTRFEIKVPKGAWRI